ncbi:MAG: protease modulator HflC [Verrucomicrobiae bacterium]|nr:protease modulator HflC [Verrucomicrobiae bacterium]
MKRNSLTVIVGAALILIFALLLFMFQVRQSEVAVVTTFGNPTRPIEKAGAYFKLPWPIQKVYKFDQRIQTFEDKFTEDLTADGINLNTLVYLGWRITDPAQFFPKFAGGSVTEAERMLESIVRHEKSGIVGKHNLSDFVNADAAQMKFDEIENQIKARVQSQLELGNYGIEIEFLGIKKLGLPESVTQTVFDRMTSERKLLADDLQSQGEAEAQKIRSAADRKAAVMLANAEGEATRIRGQGEAAAAESLPVFQKNAELAKFLLRVDALEQSLKERSTLIFDQRTPPFDLFQGFGTNRVSK